MRTLTALVAAAALVGSISIAAAQNTQSQNAPPGSANPAASSMSKSSMSKGSMGQKVTGKSKFCVQGSSGAMNCKFASMQACQKAAKGGQCMPNPKMGTTGSK